MLCCEIRNHGNDAVNYLKKLSIKETKCEALLFKKYTSPERDFKSLSNDLKFVKLSLKEIYPDIFIQESLKCSKPPKHLKISSIAPKAKNSVQNLTELWDECVTKSTSSYYGFDENPTQTLSLIHI